MKKRYVIKFKNSVDEIKKNALLELGIFVEFLNSLGIYIIELSKDVFYSLKKNPDILYIKESV